MTLPEAIDGVSAVTLRCLIVDDSRPFLDAARRLLQQQGISVVGVASSGGDALRMAAELRPDVTLIDIELGDEDGVAVAEQLAAGPDPRGGALILVSTHDDDEFREAIDASPAVGFISKASLSADAIRRLVERTRG
jgi:DNA-binding NarL/FixJ family response regulator